MHSGAIATPSMSSWTGTAPNRGFPSAKQLSFGVGCTWSHDISHLGLSTSGWGQFAVWRTRPPTAASSAPTRRPESGVKGVKKLGVRLGNWLTAQQGTTLWQAPGRERLKGKRDRAPLSVLLACGLRRHEVAELAVDHLQQREGTLGDR
jgi:site-specific recombinase XerC